MTYDAPMQAINMDGDLGDWMGPILSQTAFLPTGSGCCGGQLTVFDEFGGGIWNGVADHSIAFSMAWDTSALYIGLKVIDDTHQLNGQSGWNGDSVQVRFESTTCCLVAVLTRFVVSLSSTPPKPPGGHGRRRPLVRHSPV